MASIQEAPRHNIINSHFDIDQSSLTVMCNATRFEICVAMRDLEGTLFEHEYSKLVGKVHGRDDESVDDYEELCDWIVVPCFPELRSLAPPVPKDRVLSLQEFYHPRTYYLKIIALHGNLVAKRRRTPNATSVSPLMIPISALPDLGHVSLFDASAIMIVPVNDGEDSLCEIPQLVQTEDGRLSYFKPAFDTSQFLREVETFNLISKATLDSSARLSSLRGLVTSDNAVMMIGLLVDWIPSIGDIHSDVCIQKKEYHGKWEQQVKDTVEELHKNGIIWGDVHPGNIVIDKDLNAWVIDFGGGHVDDFVDRQISGTKDGDWQGVQRVFAGLRCLANA